MGDPLAIQDEQHNTKMRCILILAALTVVTALPRADDTVPEVPPAIESSYAHAQGIYDDLLQTTDAQGATDACSQMAQAAEDGVNNNANAAQQLIDSIDDGSKCPQEGQGAVAAAQKESDDAVKANNAAQTTLTGLHGTALTISVPFSQLTPGQCGAIATHTTHTAHHQKVVAAQKAADQAAGAATTAATALTNAKTAAAAAVAKCQCDAFNAHAAALTKANTDFAKANQDEWTKAAHLKCVVAGTAASQCTVPPLPTIKAAQMSSGVTSAACNGVQSTTTGPQWHLAPDKATSCDSGTQATKAECAAAVTSLAAKAGKTPGRSMQVGSGGTCGGVGWGGVPMGCVAQSNGDWAAHFKTSGPNCNNGGYQLVCSGQ